MLQYQKTKTPKSSTDEGVSSLLIVDKTIEISNVNLIEDIERTLWFEKVVIFRS
jgi:hypothetical protein